MEQIKNNKNQKSTNYKIQYYDSIIREKLLIVIEERSSRDGGLC